MSTDDDVARYQPFLSRLLTPDRLRHCERTMHFMDTLAGIYELDRSRAMIAGLLHDAARDLEPERQLGLAEEAGITLSCDCERHPVYLHALVGSYLVSRELGVSDDLIVDAIATHSYAGRRENYDAALSRCLRSADLLAPVHDWNGRQKLETMVLAGQLEKATLLQTSWIMEFFNEHDVPVHPNLSRIVEELSARLSVGPEFYARSKKHSCDANGST